MPHFQYRIYDATRHLLLQVLSEPEHHQTSDCKMFCITPDELLLAMNQWQVGHEIEKRKETHNCLFCGKHVDGNKLICPSHFTTELR